MFKNISVLCKVLRRVCACLLAVCALCVISVPGASFVLPVKAETLEEYKAKQNQLKAEESEIKTEISRLKNQAKSEQEKKDKLDAQVSNTKRQIENLNGQINALNKDIIAKNAEVAAKEKELEGIKELFKQRIRSMYVSGQNNELEVILGANDFADFLAKTELLRSVTENDNKLMAQVTEAIAFLNESKSEIEANKSEVSASRNTLKEKQAELDGQIAELQGAISKLDGAIAQENKHVKEIEGDLADISEQIKNLSGRNNAIFEREFKWPVPGYYSLSSPYGYRVNPVSGVYKLHAGIDISGGAIYGKPVVAAADGIVIKASDTGDGYGKCVMIDHGLNNGNRYVTLYGHNSAFNVSNGQTVKAGQTIAYIGSTGNSTGPHCHFEIRVNSSPVDPMQYFRK